ncbi:Pre-mRNA-splicing factor of RES complex-domain-containing protein [Auriculariales sp. MPI-PUGE-AT-0066]|nr:Pre-mRNA-splicing factor of RES complex-domain-containing protein [Auriculariales sp. MPI-PUGE-AT-0066]
MSSGMKAYLAQNYMSGPKADAIIAHNAPPKKKKRKAAATASSGPGIVQDDDAGFGDIAGRDDDDMVDAVVEASDRSFKKRKLATSSWTTVNGPAKAEPVEDDIPPAADELPLVVEEEPRRTGLISAAEYRAAQPKKAAVKRATSEERARQAEETIYRDTAGRKIDTKAERAESQRKKREAEELEAQKMEWGKGVVQREEAEKLRLQMERDKNRGHARYADDADLNAEQRDTMRWSDPAAAFLSKKSGKGPRKPLYQGPPPPPNRFGIKPGYRWDGVDRGNGFEKKLFQTTNARRRTQDEAYSWSVDDM